jgi:phospholipid/cholesterol/gamma-HCH transport system substrate-binding protein
MKRTLLAGASFVLMVSVGGCARIGGNDFEVTAVFTETAGLYVGNDVGVLGVPVGKITKIEPRGQAVDVTLTVTDDDVRIPASAAAVVVARSVATDRYVELTPVYTGGAEMTSGTKIPVTRTRTPVDFDHVLGSISDLASSLTNAPKATNSLGEVLRVVAEAFSGNSDEMRGAITGLADLVDTVHGQRSNVFDTMESLDRLSRSLADNRQLVRTFVRNLDAALEILESDRHEIAGVLRSTSSTIDRIAKFSHENRDAVKASLSDVKTLIENLLRSRRDLAETIEVLPLATENVANTATPDGHIWVRGDPAQVLGIAPLFEPLCEAISPTCNLATFPNLADLLGGAGP